MKAFGWFAEVYEEVKDSFAFKLKSLELDITEKILEAMKNKNMSRKDLADELGTSKSAVSKLLNNGSNITLKRLLKISMAVGYELKIELVPTNIEKSVYEIDIPLPTKSRIESGGLIGIPDSYKYWLEDGYNADAA